MKKIMLLISIASILFLVGCNKNVEEFENKTLGTYRVVGETLDRENALITLQGSDETHRYQEKTTLESDGKEFIITCDVIENGNSIDYDVRINNEKFSVFPNRRNVY